MFGLYNISLFWYLWAYITLLILNKPITVKISHKSLWKLVKQISLTYKYQTPPRKFCKMWVSPLFLFPFSKLKTLRSPKHKHTQLLTSPAKCRAWSQIPATNHPPSSHSHQNQHFTISTTVLNPPLAPRISISWSRGNSLRLSIFKSPVDNNDETEVGGKVVEVKVSGEDVEGEGVKWRRIVYGSVSPFAHLQNKKNVVMAVSEGMGYSSSYDAGW